MDVDRKSPRRRRNPHGACVPFPRFGRREKIRRRASFLVGAEMPSRRKGRPSRGAYDTARRRHARPSRRAPFISMARTHELIDSPAKAHAAVGSSQLGRAAGEGGAPFSAGAE
jgi:hypothetical protein